MKLSEDEIRKIIKTSFLPYEANLIIGDYGVKGHFEVFYGDKKLHESTPRSMTLIGDKETLLTLIESERRNVEANGFKLDPIQ